MKFSLSLIAVLAALTLAGCSTFESRARERAATFESLSPEEREKLRRGVIEIGNNSDMVYIALGKPDQTRESATPEGQQSVWIYNRYYTEYEGQYHAGYRRIVVFEPRTRRYYVYHQPVFTDVYSEHEEEQIRVKFEDGRVAEIEQPMRRAS